MSYQDIHAAEVSALLQTEGLTVIDTRDAQAQARGQLPMAQPASEAVIQGLMRKRRSNPPVLVYCYHGNSSRDLCSLLGSFGLSRVYNLVGGWDAWENFQASLQTAEQATLKPSTHKHPPLIDTHRDWLVSQGFEPDNFNSRVGLGMSPLMQATLKGEHDVVDALLAAGADPRQVNDDEHHALWFACVNGDTTLVEKLISHGSDVDNRNVNGVTCAIYAASTGKLDVLKVLVEAGANLDICTHDGISTLESASTLPVLRYLKPLMRRAG